jgi:hypothetical protein
MMLEAGYMGSKGVALPDRRAINQALLASPEAPINGITTNTAANTPLRVPYPGFSPAGLLVAETAADSHYHSLQVGLTKRFSHGLQFAASYTFSKSIDNNSGGSTTIFSEVTGDEAHIWTNKGRSDFDRTHRFVANFIYEIPQWGGRIGSSRIGRYLLNGWAVAGIVIAQSGTPFSITDSNGATFFGTTESRANWAPGATLATAILSGPVQSRLDKYFNTAAFARAGNLFGNSGRNILRGPYQRNFDLSVTKAIPVTDRLRSELRGEFFNAFNLVNFSNPRGNVSSSSFGVITNTLGNPRVVQVALKLLF